MGSYLKKYILDKLQSKNRKKIVKNLGWLFFDKIFRMGVGMLVGVWVARYLGPAQLGILSYAQAIVAIGASIAGMGLVKVVIREIILKDDQKYTLLGTSFLLMLVGAVVSIIAICGAVYLLEIDSINKSIIIVISLGIIFQSFDAVDFLFQAEVQSKYTVVAKNIAFFVVSIVKIICLIYKMPLMVFAALGTIELALGAFNMLIAYKWAGYSLKLLNFSWVQGKKLLRDSYPLVLSGLLGSIYMRIDQVMIKEMINDNSLGIYSVAVKIIETLYFVPLLVSSTLLPYVIKAYQKGEEDFYFVLKKFAQIMALAFYLVAIPIWFFADDIIFLLYGTEYILAGSVLKIYLLSLLSTYLGMVYGAFLVVRNWTRIHFIGILISCILNIILNLLLIPQYQINGAAIASLISYSTGTFLLTIVYKPMHRIRDIFVSAIVYPNPFPISKKIK